MCLNGLHGTVESRLSSNVGTNIRAFVSFVLNSIDHTGWHRVWELSVLVRAHCNLDILCLKNWLDGLNLIPRFQIVLCKYSVLRASSVIRFWVFRWKVASVPDISNCTYTWTWVLIFDTFEIDQLLRSFVGLTVAWSLIHDAEILTHIFLFLAVHVDCIFYFTICTITFPLIRHLCFFESVCNQASRKFIHSDPIRFIWSFIEFGILAHRFCWTIWLVLISDRLWPPMEGCAPLNDSAAEHWRARSWLRVSIKFSRVSWVSCVVEWVLVWSHLLVQVASVICENFALDLADSFMDIAWSTHGLDLRWVVRLLLNPGLHRGTCKITIQSILLSLLRLSEQVIDQIHREIFFHSFIRIEQCPRFQPLVLCFDSLVALLMLRETWLVYWWIHALWCRTNHDRVIFILLAFSVLHSEVLQALILMGFLQVLGFLGALLVNDDPLWILDVLIQHGVSRLQSIIFRQKANHRFTLQPTETPSTCATLRRWTLHGRPGSCRFHTVWRFFVHHVISMSKSEVRSASVVESDWRDTVGVLLGWLRCSFGLGVSRPASWEEEGVTVVYCLWFMVRWPRGPSSNCLHVLKSKLGD